MTLTRRILFSLAVAALPMLAGCSAKSTSPTPPVVNTTVFGSSDVSSGAQVAVYSYPISNASVALATLSVGAPTNMSEASEIRADSAGRIWVLNEGFPNITVYVPPLTAASAPVATINLTGTTVFHMTFDNAGNLWVASTDTNTVNEYNGPWGAVTGTMTPAANIVLTPAAFNRPEGLAFDAAGNLYVAEEGTTTVSIFTPPIATGNSPSGTLNGLTGAPDSVIVDHAGNLYVGEVSGDIARFNAPITAGSSPNTIDPAATTTAADIEGMAVDLLNNVYAMSCNHNVLEFPTGTTAFSTSMAPSASVAFTGCGGVFVR